MTRSAWILALALSASALPALAQSTDQPAPQAPQPGSGDQTQPQTPPAQGRQHTGQHHHHRRQQPAGSPDDSGTSPAPDSHPQE